MYCESCGNKLNKNDKFCEKCGTKNKNYVETNNSQVNQDAKRIHCPKCNSDNVTVQIINETHLKNAHHSFIWWIFIGFWLVLIKWIIFTIPALIFKIFGIGNNKKIVNTQKKVYICQNCGHDW